MVELKQKLVQVCNDSELPLEAILFVTKDLWRDVEETFRLAKQKSTLVTNEEKQIEKED